MKNIYYNLKYNLRVYLGLLKPSDKGQLNTMIIYTKVRLYKI